MNHYPRHVGDYLKKTLGLTMAQDGAYTRAIDWYYGHEKPLPLKPEVYGELRCLSKADRDAVNVVLARYFTETADGYRHNRCDEEIDRYHVRAESARINGRNGGRPRRETEPDTEHKPNRLAKETGPATGSEASQNQNQNQNQKEPTEGIEQSEPRRARSRGSRLPADWALPDDWGRWAMTERKWPLPIVQAVAAEFRDHWHGKGEARADWEATWRNWVRRERSRGTRNERQDARQQVASTIWPEQSDEGQRVIDAEAKRVA